LLYPSSKGEAARGDTGFVKHRLKMQAQAIHIAKGRSVMRHFMVASAALAGVMLAAAPAWADRDSETFQTRLSGFNEVGALNAETGAILTGGTGTAEVELDKAAQTATYTLTFSGAFSSAVTQSHIHFGKTHVPGGVMVFFCSNLGNGPAGTPLCPASGTVTGTWTAASVVAVPGQNVPAGDFDALVEALDSNSAYANIHTATFKAGEIRGNLRRHDRDDRD
jgi:CHRD domain-containing protein